MYISGQAKICRIDDFISAWVVENRLGMNTGLVGESAEAGNWVVDFNEISTCFERSLGSRALEDESWELGCLQWPDGERALNVQGMLTSTA